MIKYYEYTTSQGKIATKAVLDGTEYDALKQIGKVISNHKFGLTDEFLIELLMPRQFTATVVCSDEDMPDPVVARRNAKEKVMRKYYKCFDKKIDMFYKALSDFFKAF